VTARNSLLARSRRITLAGADLETPLLVPAISSKALGPVEMEETDYQRLAKPRKLPERVPGLAPASVVHTDVLMPRISEAILVSAYDIHHRFVSNADAFRRGFRSSSYSRIKAIFIDSGWYEKSVGLASGQWYHEVGDQALTFEMEDYVSLIDGLDRHVPAVVVSWDAAAHRREKPGRNRRADAERPTYVEQMRVAQDFFGSRGHLSSDFILKPQRNRRYHKFSELAQADASALKAFDVLGVTEKELGESLRDRLISLAQLRTLLDEAQVAAPIHVFGGLNPLITPLYVAVGAEIFDGLSWLRYGFRADGVSISADNASLLDHAFSTKLPTTVSHMQMNNISAIEQLADELKVFVDKGCDWSRISHGESDLRPAFEAFEAGFREGKSGR
jgi:hypothetical protein